MKFKELLQKVPFEEIARGLEHYFRNLGYKKGKIKKSFIPGCREAYDILMQLPVEQTDRKVQFCLDHERAERYEGAEIYMNLYEDNFETCPWPINLGKDIVLDEGIDISAAELAARCLFHITFYGFTPEEVERTLARYEKMAEKAMKKDSSQFIPVDLDELFGT